MDLEDAEVWDLMAAFNKLMLQTGRTGYQHQVIYDDTPIATHALNIVDQLQKQGGSIEFATIFAGKSRPQCVGMFLALLELIRRKRSARTRTGPSGKSTSSCWTARPLGAAGGGRVLRAGRHPPGRSAWRPARQSGAEDRLRRTRIWTIRLIDDPGRTPPGPPTRTTNRSRIGAPAAVSMSKPATNADIVFPASEPGSQPKSGADDDETGNGRQTHRDGPEPA